MKLLKKLAIKTNHFQSNVCRLAICLKENNISCMARTF